MSDQPDLQITDLVNDAVVADFQLDDELLDGFPRAHDADQMKGGDDRDDRSVDERPFTITVTSEDRGDFKGAPGSGIKLIGVRVEITASMGDDPDAKTKLAKFASRIESRLPATQLSDRSRHQAFCTERLKVMGIMSAQTETRIDYDLTRERVILRDFVAVQLT